MKRTSNRTAFSAPEKGQRTTRGFVNSDTGMNNYMLANVQDE